jgi:uncharacterized membrane protein YphA (DoxX/SURF4 family)
MRARAVRVLLVAIVGVVGWCVGVGAAVGAPGDLDTSFSTDGKLTTAIGTGNDFGYGVAVDSQDRVIAAGGVVYSDRFYEPYVAWYPEAPRDVYAALLWLGIASAASLSLGLLARPAAAYLAGFVAYNLFLSQTHFHHNRAFLLVLLVGLALTPIGRRFAIAGWLGRRRGRPRSSEGWLWPLLLMRFEVAAVFLVSGLSKLIDPDWWGGTVLELRFLDGRAMAQEAGLPDWLLDVRPGSRSA